MINLSLNLTGNCDRTRTAGKLFNLCSFAKPISNSAVALPMLLPIRLACAFVTREHFPRKKSRAAAGAESNVFVKKNGNIRAYREIYSFS